MEPVFEALFKLLLPSTALYSYIGDHMFRDVVPEDAAYPFVSYGLVTHESDRMFGDKSIETLTVQFSVFSYTPDETGVIYDSLIELLDTATLDLPEGYAFIDMYRETTVSVIEQHPIASGGQETVSRKAVDYTIIVEKG